MMSTLNTICKIGAILILMFSCLDSSLKAQETDTVLIESLFEKGKDFLDVQAYDSARYYLEKALTELTTELRVSPLYVDIKSKLIETDLETRRLDDFREKSRELMGFIQEHFPNNIQAIGTQYMKQGLSYAYEGKIDNAEPYFVKAKTLFERLISEKASEDNLDLTYNTVADVYNYLAIVKSRKAQPDSSDYYYEESVAAQLKSSVPDPLTMASSFYGIGISAFFQSKFDRSIEYARKIVNVLDRDNTGHLSRLSGAYLLLATCKQSIYEIDSAIYFNNLSLDIARVQNNGKGTSLVAPIQALAKTHINIGDLFTAKQLVEEALQIEMEEGVEKTNMTAVLYSYLAQIAIRKNHALNEGLSYYDKALDLVTNYSDKAPQAQNLIMTLNKNSALSYLSKAQAARSSGALQVADSSYQEAIRRLKLALEIDEKVTRGVGSADIVILVGLGRAYAGFENYDLAKKALQEAVKRSGIRNIKGNQEEARSSAFLALADISLKEGDLKQFDYYWNQAQPIMNKYRAETLDQQIDSFNLMAEKKLKEEGFDEAISYVQQALQVNRLSADNPANRPDYLTDYIGYATSLALLPKIYQAKYDIHQNLEDLKLAQQYLKQYNDEVIGLITEAANRNDLIDQMAVYNEKIQNTAFTSYQLFRITGDEQYKEDAFKASQQSRSVIFRSSAVQNDELSYALIPDSIVTQIGKIKSRVSYYSGLLKTAELTTESQEKQQSIKDKLFQSQENLRLYRVMLQEDYPEYFSYKYDNQTFSSQNIQDQLQAGTTYLEYINGAEDILVFLITKDDFSLTSIPKKEGIDLIASNLTQVLKSNVADSINSSLTQLYEQYVAPVKASLKGEKLLIVPDGNLWNVNFDLLKAKATAPYLIEDYSISYAYSANAIFKRTLKKKSKKKMLAYSFGKASNMIPSNSVFRGVEQTELPGSALEINNLSKLTSGDFFYEEGASETSFKAMANDYSIIHLAIHGEIDEFDYDRSRLYFNTNLADSLNDGLLYPFELYNMNLNADLVVLSACNSGGGLISRGEGIMSLGRAFQYAGVSSLLLSKWEISDAVAPAIITTFYNYLDEGMHKDEALRQAKLDFIKSADNLTASPYYWGSFFILGDTAPVSLKTSINYTQLILIFCLFIISASWAFRARMRKAQKNPDA